MFQFLSCIVSQQEAFFEATYIPNANVQKDARICLAKQKYR